MDQQIELHPVSIETSTFVFKIIKVQPSPYQYHNPYNNSDDSDDEEDEDKFLFKVAIVKSPILYEMFRMGRIIRLVLQRDSISHKLIIKESETVESSITIFGPNESTLEPEIQFISQQRTKTVVKITEEEYDEIIEQIETSFPMVSMEPPVVPMAAPAPAPAPAPVEAPGAANEPYEPNMPSSRRRKTRKRKQLRRRKISRRH